MSSDLPAIRDEDQPPAVLPPGKVWGPKLNPLAVPESRPLTAEERAIVNEKMARYEAEQARRYGGEAMLEIGLDWDWDEERGKLLDNRTGLDLLVDGEPNPAIPDAPDREGYERPDWKLEANED